MKMIGAVCFLLLCCCSATLANSIHPNDKNLRSRKLVGSSISYSVPPNLTGALLKTQSSSPYEHHTVNVAEPSAVWFMIIGLPAVILGVGRREGLVLSSAAPRPIIGENPHADSSFAENEEVLRFSCMSDDPCPFSELEKHIIRLLLLGLRDDRISSLLHVPQHTLQQRIFRIMAVDGSLSRDEMIAYVSSDPQFLPWLRFLDEVAQVDDKSSVRVGIHKLPNQPG